MPVAIQTAGVQWRRRWDLVFEDTFPGPGLDRTKWDSEGAAFNYGDANQGQKLYGWNPNTGGTPRAQNCVISPSTTGGTGNSLKLIAIRGEGISTGGVAPDPAPWTTSQINTAAHFGVVLPFRLEVRMKVQLGDGLRPIAWMTHGGSPTMEIDSPELFVGGTAFNNSTGTRDAQCSCFWNYSKGFQAGFQNFHVNLDWRNITDYHTWEYELTDRHMGWWLDGLPVQSIAGGVSNPTAMGDGETFKWSDAAPNGAGEAAYPNPYTNANAMHVKLGLQVNGPASSGGPTTTSGPSATPSPVQVEYDYVRVYSGA